MAARTVARTARPPSSKRQFVKSRAASREGAALPRPAPVAPPASVVLPTRQEIAARVSLARNGIVQAQAVVETAALATHGLAGDLGDSATLRRVLREASEMLDRVSEQLDPLALLKA